MYDGAFEFELDSILDDMDVLVELFDEDKVVETVTIPLGLDEVVMAMGLLLDVGFGAWFMLGLKDLEEIEVDLRVVAKSERGKCLSKESCCEEREFS